MVNPEALLGIIANEVKHVISHQASKAGHVCSDNIMCVTILTNSKSNTYIRSLIILLSLSYSNDY